MTSLMFFVLTWGFTSVRDILDVILIPFILAIFGLIIPRLWQNRERDLQIKKILVTEISQLVMSTVVIMHLFKTNSLRESDKNKISQSKMDETLQNWKIQACVIGSKLHAYFPGKNKQAPEPMHKRWANYCDMLSDYCEKNEKVISITDHWKKMQDDFFGPKAAFIEEILACKIEGFRD